MKKRLISFMLLITVTSCVRFNTDYFKNLLTLISQAAKEVIYEETESYDEETSDSAVDHLEQELEKLDVRNLFEKECETESGTATINPNDIRFSQSSVNGASEIIDSMKAKGWDGDPIDVVRMPDGNLTTIDNTRVLAARYAEIDVQANVHAFDEVLPQDLDLIERLTTPKGVAQTWGMLYY